MSKNQFPYIPFEQPSHALTSNAQSKVFPDWPSLLPNFKMIDIRKQYGSAEKEIPHLDLARIAIHIGNDRNGK